MNPVTTKKRTMFGMAGCYAMGNFTDNFIKQAAVLMAVGLGSLQSMVTVLFAIPFVIFSAWAGWLSDRLPKRGIVIGAKVVELLAITIGGIAIWKMWWPGIMAVIFLMATQSTIFTPAINGAIPENFARGDVPRVNSIIRSISTAAVLAGIALAGPLLDLRPEHGIINWVPTLSTLTGAEYGRLSTGLFAILISCIGLLLALSIKRSSSPKGDTAPFPWAGPIDSCRHILEYRKDKALFTVMSGDAFFYGLAPIVVISIANLAKSLHYSDTLTSLLSASLMVGIAIGALIGGRYTPDSWKRLMVPALTGMGLCLFLAGLTPFLQESVQLPWFVITLFIAGVWGGIYIIPIASFLQVHPASHEKGKVLAASNFYSFLSMAVFGGLFWLISQLPPQLTFLLYASMALAFAWCVIRPRMRHHLCAEVSIPLILALMGIIWLASLLPGQGALIVYALLALGFGWFWLRPQLHKLNATTVSDAGRSPLGAFLTGLLRVRYTISTVGFENLSLDKEDDRPILFLPNHPALVDPLVVYSRIAGMRPRILSDEKRMSGPIERYLVKKLGIITIPDPFHEGRRNLEAVREGLDAMTKALRDGHNLLLYPSGAIYRSDKERIGANSAVSHILAEVPHVRVVLLRTSGLWGSSFSRANGRSPSIFRNIFRLLPVLLVNLLFFMPKRKVTVECRELQQWSTDKMTLNKQLEAYYNEHPLPPTRVPYYFWQGSTPVPMLAPNRPLPEKLAHISMSPKVEEKVRQLIHEQTGIKTSTIERESRLTSDLGLDSLDIMSLVTLMETTFGYPIPELDKLITVEDCFLAASGQLFSAEELTKQGPPSQWLSLEGTAQGARPLALPPMRNNLIKGFLGQVKKAPSLPLLADRNGIKTRKEVLTGALALCGRFKKLSGKRLGIMLPATPAASIVWLAAQLAGKEPVMLNWTVGRKNLDHCLRQAQVQHIVTARALMEQITRQGFEAPSQAACMHLEDMAKNIGLYAKVRAFIRSSLFCLTGFGISTRNTPKIATILFTSGSESMPKGVPLTHHNILVNAADIATQLQLTQDIRVLAMLPPFHSFGFIVGITLPLFGGVQAAFHPNPTESNALVGMVRDYKLSLLGATPTFLEAMLASVQHPRDLTTLRYAFVGAEKCPDSLHDRMAHYCPHGSLCEGYGITECSPVISVNIPGQTRRGSIGIPLPSVECAVVIEDEASMHPAPLNTTGMLLVRGPSIFEGYLASANNPFVEYDGKRWYRTGDLVQIDEEKALYFKGRLSRFVKIAGEMISLPQIETVLQTALQVHAPADGAPFIAVTANEQKEGRPVLQLFTPLTITVDEVNSILRESGLSGLYTLQKVVIVPHIPLLGTGKVDYRQLDDSKCVIELPTSAHKERQGTAS